MSMDWSLQGDKGQPCSSPSDTDKTRRRSASPDKTTSPCEARAGWFSFGFDNSPRDKASAMENGTNNPLLGVGASRSVESTPRSATRGSPRSGGRSAEASPRSPDGAQSSISSWFGFGTDPHSVVEAETARFDWSVRGSTRGQVDRDQEVRSTGARSSSSTFWGTLTSSPLPIEHRHPQRQPPADANYRPVSPRSKAAVSPPHINYADGVAGWFGLSSAQGSHPKKETHRSMSLKSFESPPEDMQSHGKQIAQPESWYYSMLRANSDPTQGRGRAQQDAVKDRKRGQGAPSQESSVLSWFGYTGGEAIASNPEPDPDPEPDTEVAPPEWSIWSVLAGQEDNDQPQATSKQLSAKVVKPPRGRGNLPQKKPEPVTETGFSCFALPQLSPRYTAAHGM